MKTPVLYTRKVLKWALGHEPDDDPVEVLQREVALDVEDDVLADADLAVARPDVDVAVEGRVRGVSGRLRVRAALLRVAVVRHLEVKTILTFASV